MNTYGKITRDSLYLNQKALEHPWDPDTNITQVFSNGTKCRKFAREGNNPISDIDYVHALVIVFRNSGVLEAGIRDWENLLDDQQTVANAITHFTNANKLRLAAKQCNT
jgi:hypothetical protein